MRKGDYLFIALAAAILISGVSVYYIKNKAPEKPVYVAQEQSKPLNADTIFDLVNAERAKNGLQPLIRDARLDATAQARADDMVARNYYSHYDPVTGELMIAKQDAGCRFSENMSRMEDSSGDNNIDAVVGWMGSENHRNAMLNPDYTNSGIAVSDTNVVQHFCTR